MSQPIINKDNKDKLIDAGEEVLENYSKSEAKTEAGRKLRIGARILVWLKPILKAIKITPNANRN